MELVIVKATKTAEAGKTRITYDYEVTLPISNLNDNCLSPHILNYLAEFIQNLVGDREDV